MYENNCLGDWYPREAPSAVFGVEILLGGFRLLVDTKDRGEPPDGGAASTVADIDATEPGLHAVAARDLKDLVRLSVARDSRGREWCHFRLLRPIWGGKDVQAPPSEGGGPRPTIPRRESSYLCLELGDGRVRPPG